MSQFPGARSMEKRPFSSVKAVILACPWVAVMVAPGMNWSAARTDPVYKAALSRVIRNASAAQRERRIIKVVYGLFYINFDPSISSRAFSERNSGVKVAVAGVAAGVISVVE